MGGSWGWQLKTFGCILIESGEAAGTNTGLLSESGVPVYALCVNSVPALLFDPLA